MLVEDHRGAGERKDQHRCNGTKILEPMKKEQSTSQRPTELGERVWALDPDCFVISFLGLLGGNIVPS